MKKKCKFKLDGTSQNLTEKNYYNNINKIMFFILFKKRSDGEEYETVRQNFYF